MCRNKIWTLWVPKSVFPKANPSPSTFCHKKLIQISIYFYYLNNKTKLFNYLTTITPFFLFFCRFRLVKNLHTYQIHIHVTFCEYYLLFIFRHFLKNVMIFFPKYLFKYHLIFQSAMISPEWLIVILFFIIILILCCIRM